MAQTQLRSDISTGVDFLLEKRFRIGYLVVFFTAVGVLSTAISELRPVAVAAALVIPMRLLVRIATGFEAESYGRWSPMLANLRNYRFVAVTALLATIPVSHWYLKTELNWSELGRLAHVIVGCSIAILGWSEGIYEKNYYFDRWHVGERVALLVLGGLAIAVSPVFVPLFLLVHKILTDQFDYPGIGDFNWTHSKLPHTILLIVSGFVVAGLSLDIESEMVLFLLFCGYAAHYFHPGIAKLRNGPVYYLWHNNPICMFLNGYQIGWLSSLDEDTVLRVGQVTNRLTPLFNGAVILIEMGAILVLFSAQLAPVIASLTLALHLLIFASTGDDFWKWMAVDISIVVGLLFVVDQPPAVFGDMQWFALSLLFVTMAHAWMNPAGMNWLDPPYVEYFRFEADLRDGSEAVPIHPNIFRPYDTIMTQGSTGTLTYLGKNPRITYSHGAMTEFREKDFHERLVEALHSPPPDSEEATEIVEEYGVDWHDPEKTEQLRMFLQEFVDSKQTAGHARLLRYLSSPREFYSTGISDRKSYSRLADIERIRILRIDGIWTNEGFEKLAREEVLSVQM